MIRVLIIIILAIPIMSLAQEANHVFVFLNSKPDKAEISDEEKESLQAAHIKNIDRLVTEGKMIVAGPFENGGGSCIFKSISVAETKQWLSTDPAVKANRWDIEMYPIRFLKGGAFQATEPYEMAIYNFTRVRLINDIASYKMNQGNLDIWNEPANDSNVIMVGAFPQSDGGIIINLSDEQELSFEVDRKDYFRLEHKLLWAGSPINREN
jgi:uncharacterized protein YciI